LAQQADATKAYQALAGDPAFIEPMRTLIFSGRSADRMAAIQSAGGTGALRIAFELAKAAAPEARVHVGLPTWPSHETLAQTSGLECIGHRYFDRGGNIV